MSQTFQSFTLFSQLPKEIRVKIWTFSIPHHRVIRLKFNGNSTPSIWGTYQGWKVHAPTIPGLAVTWESRQETLKHYKRIELLPFHSSRIGSQYFNYDRDILIFGGQDGYRTLQEWVWMYMFPEDWEYTISVHTYQAVFFDVCSKLQQIAIAPPKRLQRDMSILTTLIETFVFTNLQKVYTPRCTFRTPWGRAISYVDSRDSDPTNARIKQDFLWGHQRLAERRAEEEERLARLKLKSPPATETLLVAIDKTNNDDDYRANRISLETIRLKHLVGTRDIDIIFSTPDEMEAMGFGKLSKRYRYPKEIRDCARDVKR